MARPITNPVTYGTASGNEAMSNLDTSFNTVFTTGFNDSSLGWVNYAADTGTANAYAVTLSVTPSSYTSGMCVAFTPQNNNTGTSTINVNALGTKTIVTPSNVALSGGEINQNALCVVVYDGTSFRIVSTCQFSINFGSVSTNQTVNAAGYSSVSVALAGTATSQNLIINNVSFGALIAIRFVNSNAGNTTFTISGTNAAGSVLAVTAYSGGNPTNMVTGAVLASNNQRMFTGTVIGANMLLALT